MRVIKFFFISLLLISLTACGGGDTKILKQVVEQNKLNIVSLVLNSKYTQTLVPANKLGAIPTFYFPHDSSEQITVTGITENGDEVSLSNTKFSIIDNAGGASTIDDNGNLTLEPLGVTTTKQITVQAEFSSLIGTATVIISSFPLQANGLLLYVNGTAAGTSYTATVCDTTLFEARGVFDDNSTRTITRKVVWSDSIDAADRSKAKFDVTDPDKPLFSSHTNTITSPNTPYVLNVAYNSLPPSVTIDVNVSQSGFSNMVISPTSKTLELNAIQPLSLSANINSLQTTKLETKAKWTTTDATIVDVNTSTGVVTGKVLGGPITIFGQCGSETMTSSITVKKLELNSIEIRNASSVASDLITFDITAGNPKTHQLTLFALYSDGSEANISSDTTNISWSINLTNGVDGAITIDNSGIVTATLQGDGTVRVAYKSRLDTISIKVNVK